MITDAHGIPLVVRTGPANERDEQRLGPMLDRLPAIPGPRGRPRRKPGSVQGDAAYGFPHTIADVRRRRIKPLLAHRSTPGHPVEHGSGLGKTRYVVERTLSWFGNFRRIKFCYECWGEHFQAFHDLAACLLCAKRLSQAT